MKRTLTSRAQFLRNNPTEAEKKLWHHIRQRQINELKFRRQQNIDNKYIVDFVCLEKRLIIELDGGQHTEKTDKARSDYLKNQGFEIIRFWNNEIFENMEGVLEVIRDKLDTPTHPSPVKGEE